MIIHIEDAAKVFIAAKARDKSITIGVVERPGGA